MDLLSNNGVRLRSQTVTEPPTDRFVGGWCDIDLMSVSAKHLLTSIVSRLQQAHESIIKILFNYFTQYKVECRTNASLQIACRLRVIRKLQYLQVQLQDVKIGQANKFCGCLHIVSTLKSEMSSLCM